MAKNKSWKNKLTRRELFGSLEKVTCTIQNRRIALSGHVFRDESSPAQYNSVITGVPPGGRGLVERACPLTT